MGGRGGALAIATNDQSIYYTANHGPPLCSGPGASAPPSPMVNVAPCTSILVNYLSLLVINAWITPYLHCTHLRHIMAPMATRAERGHSIQYLSLYQPSHGTFQKCPRSRCLHRGPETRGPVHFKWSAGSQSITSGPGSV